MRFTVSGKDRYYPSELYSQLVGPVPPKDFESNGCSCSPDYIGHISIWPACHRHDWRYSTEGTWADRKEADRNLRYNINICLVLGNMNQAKANIISWVYWSRVRLYGAEHFNFREDEVPLNFWQRWKEVYCLFRDKR